MTISAGIFHLGIFMLVTQQPEQPLTNRWHRRVQRIKEFADAVQGGKVSTQFGRNFHVPSFYVLACSTRTKGHMDKQMPQADLPHQIGLNRTIQGILIVVESGGRGG